MSLFPAEILEAIFSYLPTADLKRVSLASHQFHELAAALLWKEPIFRHKIHVEDKDLILEEISQRRPIRRLEASIRKKLHLRPRKGLADRRPPDAGPLTMDRIAHLPIQKFDGGGGVKEHELRRIVKGIQSKLVIPEFHAVSLCFQLFVDDLKLLMTLPLTKLSYEALWQPDPGKVINFLLSLPNPPELTVNWTDLNCQLDQVEQFSRLVQLPISSIICVFHQNANLLRQFCQIAKAARTAKGKATKFSIVNGTYTPDGLTFFIGLNISELWTEALAWNMDISDFIPVIQQLKPLRIRINSHLITASNLNQLPNVCAIYAEFLDFKTATVDEYVSLIVKKHREFPITVYDRFSGNKLSFNVHAVLREAGILIDFY